MPFSPQPYRRQILAPRRLAPGMLLGSLLLALSVFMNIFSNVWGYVEPVSPFFRNKFWLPFLFLAGGDDPGDLPSSEKHTVICKLDPQINPPCWSLAPSYPCC